MGLFLDQKQKTPYEDVLRTPKISTPTSLDTATATPVSVVRVVDGDTISVLLDGSETKVRLIGINAPESVDPRRPVQCFGKEAAAHMTELLSQHKVELLYDISQDRYDKYGRLLAYVYRDDGVFINEAMIHDGYAYEYTYKTPYEFQQEFKTTEREARSEANGLWSPLTCNGRY
jgi:micrococcal nuclease